MPEPVTPAEQDDTLAQLIPDDAPPVPFWRTLLRFTRAYHARLVLAGFCALVVGVAVALQPMVVKFVVDSGINRKTASGDPAPMDQKMKWAAIFAGVYLALGVARVSIWIIGYRRLNAAVEGFVFDLRSRFFRHVQRLCFRFHDQVSSGELFNYIMGSPIQSLKMFLRQGGMIIPYQAVSWCVAVAVLLSFNWAMTLITIGMALTVVLINRRSRFVIREMSADFLKTESHVSRYVADMLRGSRAVKIYAMEDNVLWSFNDQAVRIRDQGIRLANRQQLEGVKPEVVQYTGIAAIYAAGAWFCVYRGMEVGTFLAFVSSVSLLMGPLMTLTQLNLIRGNAEAGLERIVRILQVDTTTPEVPEEVEVEVADQRRLARQEQFPFLICDHLGFEYETGQPVLRDICLRVPAGQSVALVGPSGSGKTTFISLMLRLYDPTKGRILLNGIDLFNYNIRELRSSFGVVPQDPFIFQGTIRDNLRLTDPDASDGELREAMDLAHVSEFVDKLPQGPDTPVGESGFSLSGGQRQRIAIARAVLAKPKSFIFDEATSALDNESERRIQSAMERLMQGRNMFIIAHRLSTVRHVDRILVFDQGAIVQDGSYDELAEVDGIFKRLLDSAREGSGFLE